MRRAIPVLMAALLLATAPAFAGGEGGSKASGKTPAPGTDRGFGAATAFFAMFFRSGNLFVAGYESVDRYSGIQAVDRSFFDRYWSLRSRPDAEKVKKIAESLERVRREGRANPGSESPKSAPDLAPVRDPDALPGLDY